MTIPGQLSPQLPAAPCLQKINSWCFIDGEQVPLKQLSHQQVALQNFAFPAA